MAPKRYPDCEGYTECLLKAAITQTEFECPEKCPRYKRKKTDSDDPVYREENNIVKGLGFYCTDQTLKGTSPERLVDTDGYGGGLVYVAD